MTIMNTTKNSRLPAVMAPSSVTVALAVKLSVLKSAITSTPVYVLLPVQLLAVFHAPPAGLVQVMAAMAAALS